MMNRLKTRHESCSDEVCPAGASQNQNLEKTVFPVNFRKRFRGSLTIEAAASLPLFLMICAAVLSFLILCSLQMNIQIRMEETARIMGKAAYLLDHSLSSGSVSAMNGESVGTDELSVMSAGINSASIKLIMLSGKGFPAKIGKSRITGGASGLYTHESSYQEQNGILDIVVNYDYPVPWVPQTWGRLRLVQRMRTHVWIGTSLSGAPGGMNAGSAQGASGTDTVYVTPTGTVYHTSPSCHYLDLSIHTASYDSISSERNANGAKYHKCPLCSGSLNSDTVYITDYGTDWHASLECSGLKRTVMEIDRSEAEGMRLCTKCRDGNHNHD